MPKGKKRPVESSTTSDPERSSRRKGQKAVDNNTSAKEDTPTKESEILTVVIGNPPKNNPDGLHDIVGNYLYVAKQQNGGLWGMFTKKTVSDHQHKLDQMPLVLEKFEKDLKHNTDARNDTQSSTTTKKTERTNNIEEKDLLLKNVKPMQNQVDSIKAKIEKHDEDGPFVNQIVGKVSESDRTEMIAAHDEARKAMKETQSQTQEAFKTQNQRIARLTAEIERLDMEIPQLEEHMKALELKRKQLLVFSARIVATMHALAHTSVNLVCSSMGMDVNALEGAAQGVQPAIGPP